MNTTKRDRRTASPKTSRVITSSPVENLEARSAQVSELAIAIRSRIAALAPSAAVRVLLVELERYERTAARWSTFAPSEAQCDALCEELDGLDARVRELLETAPRKVAKLLDATHRTTTKLPRVT